MNCTHLRRTTVRGKKSCFFFDKLQDFELNLFFVFFYLNMLSS